MAEGDGGPSVRRATDDDSTAVADLWLRSRRAAVPAIPAPVHSDEEVRAWFGSTVIPARETWVIEEGGTIVALLVIDEGWIDQLYVDPPHVRKGLGTRLVDIAKTRSSGRLDLWTFQSNIAARRFYEHLGFVAVGATDGDNEEGAPDVRYHWERIRR